MGPRRHAGRPLPVSLGIGLLLSVSCTSTSSDPLTAASDDEVAAAKGTSALDRIQPTLMVIPSDAMLRRLNCLSAVDNQGVTSYKRDYQRAFIQDSELRFAIASVEKEFTRIGYPLENLEQQLKTLQNAAALDAMEGIAKDARTLLLTSTRPDYIVELDYELAADRTSRNPKRSLNYILTCLDTYTGKTIASITRADIASGALGSVPALLAQDLSAQTPDLHAQIRRRFTDLLANGAEITLRLTVEENAPIRFTDECLGDENYNDWVNAWLKWNTVNSTFKPVMSTDREMLFTNVRIRTVNENGERFTTYDFARLLSVDMGTGCGVVAINRTQGIGDAYLVFTGLK